VRIASLGSGSRGNGTLIEDGDTRLLVDLGFSIKDTTARLHRLGCMPQDVSAVLVTHEHADHISGVIAFAEKFAIPVYMSAGTYYSRRDKLNSEVVRFSSHRTFSIGSLNVEPVPVPHDAREPCQFVFSAGGHRVGLLTDIGHITPHVVDRYHQLDVLMLECNYDPNMLSSGPYPFKLKQRVAGSYGHLSNLQAAELVSGMDCSALGHVVVSHISEKNNLPELAMSAVNEALGHWHGDLLLSDQDCGFDWLSVGAD
jgi:phosphoribosyl 1,2-cyclic phosphodiesterase